MPTAGTRVEYTCPMHPEIVRPGPGNVPHLRHGAGTAHGHCARRRESGTARHDSPLLGSCGSDHSAAGDRHGRHASRHAGATRTSGGWLPWIELLLASPVVLWGGWPFFQRGWASVVNRSTNMFTLIAMGTGVAYLYSLVATLAPGIFPDVISRDAGDARRCISKPRRRLSPWCCWARCSNCAPAATPGRPSVPCSA